MRIPTLEEIKDKSIEEIYLIMVLLHDSAEQKGFKKGLSLGIKLTVAKILDR